jgi:hypothetical protein
MVADRGLAGLRASRPSAAARQWQAGRDAHRCGLGAGRGVATTALVKCVVPMMTTSMAPASMPDAASTSLSALTTPLRSHRPWWPTSRRRRRCYRPSRAASVLVPPTSIPILLIGRSPRRGIRTARSSPKATGAVWASPLGVRKRAGAGRAHHRHPLAVAQPLGADRLARDAVEDADEVGRRHLDRIVAPGPDQELILEVEPVAPAAVVVEPVEVGGAAQVPLGRPPRHVGDLAAEEPAPALAGQHRLHRVLVAAARLVDGPAPARSPG